jgi:hypothetical protein
MKHKLICTLTLATALLPSALRAEEPSKWTFEVTPYLLMPGIFGDIGIGPINRPVDVSFDKIWHNLEFTAMGTVSVGYDRWTLTTDVIYLGVGGTKDVGVGNREVVTGYDFQQWMVEPTLSYSVCKGFDVLAGARYNNIDVSINGPLLGDPSGTEAWWDPIIGAHLSLPLGKGFGVGVNGDIGGFGAGSDLTWQAYPYLGWQFAKWGSLQAGYRFLYMDYENGSGLNRFKYDVTYRGPQVGVTFRF